jgi:hypothetical protein
MMEAQKTKCTTMHTAHKCRHMYIHPAPSQRREWSVANPDQADDHQLMRVVVGESRMLSSLW